MLAPNSSSATWTSWQEALSLSMDNLSHVSPETYTAALAGGGTRGVKSDCRLFNLLFYTVFMGFLCLLGAVGNTVSILVLQKDRGNQMHAATFLLQALAVADNSVLVISFFSLSVVFGLLPFLDADEERRRIVPYIFKYVQPLANMALTATVWMTVLLALNRFIAICRPFDTHRLANLSKVRLQVLVVFIAAVLFNVPRFFQYDIVYPTAGGGPTKIPPSVASVITLLPADLIANTTLYYSSLSSSSSSPGVAMKAPFPRHVPTSMGPKTTFGVVYTNALYTLLVHFLPMILLIVLNGLLIVELRRMSRRRETVPNQRRSEENITLVMVIVIIVFIVCNTPDRINEIIKYFISARPCTPLYYLDCVSMFMVVLNSSVNFLIYYIFRRRFRQILIRKLCFRSRRLSLTGSFDRGGGGGANGQAAGVSENPQAMTLLSTNGITQQELTTNTVL